MKFQAIGFDYNGVVVGKLGFMKGMAETIGMPLDELRKIYFQHNSMLNVEGMPYKKFFKMLLGKLGKKDKYSDVLIYIDDSERSLELSQEVGFYPILFTGYGDLIKKLSFMGVLNNE